MNTANLRSVTLDSIIDLPVFPVAAIFPMLDESPGDGVSERPTTLTLSELADSINEHGLQEAIVLFNGQILDGRNRRAACVLAAEANEQEISDFVVQVEDFLGSEEEAEEFVLTLNVDRRDLNPTQRANIAVDFWELAPSSQGQRTDLDHFSPNLGRSFTGSAEWLSQRFRVSRGYIELARKIRKNKEAAEAAAGFAAQEVHRQREIAEQAAIAAKTAAEQGDATRAADFANKANYATTAATNAQEENAQKSREAESLNNSITKMMEGSKTLHAVVKEEPGHESTGEDAVKKLRTKLNSSFLSFMEAARDLSKDGDEADLDSIQGKANAIYANWGDNGSWQ